MKITFMGIYQEIRNWYGNAGNLPRLILHEDKTLVTTVEPSELLGPPLLMEPSMYLASVREGYAAISLLIPFLKPISSIAAAEYPVGLDEDMGQEGTGSGP